MDEATAFGSRVREVRGWRGLSLREAAGLAGMSFGFWGQIERGEKPVTSRTTLNAMASALRVHPAELTGQPWTPQGVAGGGTPTALMGMETALERYELGVDPELPVRPWPQIAEDLERLVTVMSFAGDYAAQSALAPVLLGELHGAYVRLPDHRPEVLLGLMNAYSSAIWTTTRLGGCGLPSLAARAAQQCAEALGDPVWLGYAVFLRGAATGRLDRAAVYRRSVAAAEALSSHLDDLDAVQACGVLHLSAAWAAATQADHTTAATHLAEASALATRMDTEVGTWAYECFGRSEVGVWKTYIAVECREPGQALQAARTVHAELLPATVQQAGFWAAVGRALVAEKKTREQGIRVLVRAERLAPQLIRHDQSVRDTVLGLLRQARRDASGRELRGLAWRMGLAPLG